MMMIMTTVAGRPTKAFRVVGSGDCSHVTADGLE